MKEFYSLMTDAIMKLYLYADWTKAIHYSTKSNHTHELCDKVRDGIISFTDDIAETYFGLGGTPAVSDFDLSKQIKKTNDLGEICREVIEIASYMRKNLQDDVMGWCMTSEIDDFIGEMSKNVFLAKLDKFENEDNVTRKK